MFNLPADRGKPARPSRDHDRTAAQWCTRKSPQASAPLPCSKWRELRVSVEAVLQSASIQVEMMLLLLINCWRPSGMTMFKCRSGNWFLPFPLQTLHFGYNFCSFQSPCTQILEAQNGKARTYQLGSSSDVACGSALKHTHSGHDGGSNSRIL